MKDPLDRFKRFYDEFSESWIARVEELYAPGFHFQDPFHRVENDFDTLRTYFRHVLTALAFTKFIVDDAATGEDGSYVRWRWEWKRKQNDPLHTVVGVTHLRFGADGKIIFHQDLFDAAEGFFETLPVIGSALRFVKKRV
ncbi:MAG: nuclear transport factor 2 family protein [Kofleriaceae bacterium]